MSIKNTKVKICNTLFILFTFDILLNKVLKIVFNTIKMYLINIRKNLYYLFSYLVYKIN